MKRNFVKTVVFIITAILIVLSCGCESQSVTDNIEIPEYQSDEEMMIGIWLEPINTFEDYKLAKDAGITHIITSGSYEGGPATNEFKKTMGFCEDLGLKVIIRSCNTYPYVDLVDDYRELSSAIVGINYWDEPFVADYPKLAEMAEGHINKYGDDLLYFVNLSPNVIAPGWHPWGDDETYAEYVDRLYTEVLSKIIVGKKMISCDHYPIQEINGVRALGTTWLSNLGFIAEAAKKYNCDTNFFVASASWEGYPEPTLEDLRFTFITEMAFGIRNFTYYTYNTYAEGLDYEATGVVSSIKSGKVNPVYYAVSQVNKELKSIEDVYLSFKWEGVMPVVGSQFQGTMEPAYKIMETNKITTLKSIDCIKSYSCEQNTLFGAFKDKDDRDGLVVTNYNLPYSGKNGKTTIEFNDAKKALVYKNGERFIYNLSNNKLNLRLDAGEGVFIIPLA